MKKNMFLHELIHSLSPVEKRYVKRQLSEKNGEQNENLQLFDAMNEQEVYDELQIRKKFRDRTFIRQLDVKKYYLYNSVLESLQRFNNKRLGKENLISQIDVLISMNLHRHAMVLLIKGIEIAERHQDFLFEIRLLEQQLILSNHLPEINREKTLKRISSSLRKYENLNAFGELFTRFQQIVRKYSFVRTSAQKAAYDRIMRDPMLKSEKSALSLRPLLYFQLIHYFYYASIGNWIKASAYARRMYELVIKNPEAKGEFSLFYLNASANFMAICMLGNGTQKEFEKVLKRLKKDISGFDSNYLRILAQTRIFQFQIISINKEKRWKESKKILPDLVDFMEENQQIIETGKLKFLYFDVAKTYFLLGDHRNANKWLLRTEMPGPDGVNADVYSFSRILHQINQIDSGEVENIRQNIQTLRRQLRKLGVYHSFESFMLSFISREYIKWPDLGTKERKELMLQFLLRLHIEMKKEWSVNVRIYFDFENWAREKMI